MAKAPLSFKDYLTVDYTPGMPDQVSYNAMKRKRGRIGEEVEHEEDVSEALTFQQRRKKAIQMRKLQPRIKMGRKRAMKRAATPDVIDRRTRRQARNAVFKKLTKDMPKDQLTFARRKEIETRIDKTYGKLVDRLARKMKPQVRKTDRERRASKK